MGIFAAALLLITAAGVLLFLLVTTIARHTLRHWHESETSTAG